MKLVCRTVTGASTNFDVDASETIGAIKQRMAGDYDLASLRLCHKGKVLDDAKSLADLGFNDGEVLIIAGKKAKPAAAAPAPAATPAPAPAQTAPPQETAPAAQPAPAQESAPAPAPAQESAPAPAPEATAAPAPSGDAPLPPGVDASQVEMIMGMGFPDRAGVIRALQCAFGNADRAVEYMCTGIPAGIEQQFRQQEAQRQAPPPQASASTPQGQASSPSAGGGGGGGGMSAEALGSMMAQMQQGQQPEQQGSALRRALAGIPQFEQIRGLVSQNSAALPTVMQQLQQHHPEVFELVQANPQEFLDIINEGPGAVGGGGSGAGSAAGEAEALPQLTAADQPAIERLVALGGGQWDARAAALVFMVCRRNEELAANVLFDNGGVPPELLQALAEGSAGMGGGEGDSDDEGEA